MVMCTQHLKIMVRFEVNRLPWNKTALASEFNLRKTVVMNSVECRNNENCNLNQLYELCDLCE